MEGHQRCGQESLVHANFLEGDWDVCEKESSSQSDLDSSNGTTSQNEKSTKCKIRKTVPVMGIKTIDDILRCDPTCPPDAFFHLKEFYQNNCCITFYITNFVFLLYYYIVIGVFPYLYKTKKCPISDNPSIDKLIFFCDYIGVLLFLYHHKSYQIISV